MAEQTNTPDLSGLLQGLLSNPQAMSMLTGILGQLPAKQAAAPPKQLPECPPPSEPSPHHLPPPDRKNNDRRALLLALRPFLSPDRQKALDKLLMMEQALSLFYQKQGKKEDGTSCI